MNYECANDYHNDQTYGDNNEMDITYQKKLSKTVSLL